MHASTLSRRFDSCSRFERNRDTVRACDQTAAHKFMGIIASQISCRTLTGSTTLKRYLQITPIVIVSKELGCDGLVELHKKSAASARQKSWNISTTRTKAPSIVQPAMRFWTTRLRFARKSRQLLRGAARCRRAERSLKTTCSSESAATACPSR